MAISDIHGCYEQFNQLLKKVQFDSANDKLILLGDYVDRGLRSKDVLEQVKALKEEFGVIALRGNHDQMMYDALMQEREDLDSRWIRNGARQTIESYCGADYFGEELDRGRFNEAKQLIKNNYMHHVEFLNSLDLYYESDSHIFVHAGINPAVDEWKKQTSADFIWIRENFYNHPTGLDKTVVFGHTPVVNLHDSENVWFSSLGDKIGIDGGCVFGKQLNCLEIDESDEYKTYYILKDYPSLFDAIEVT
ncbi:metallophosphoesterase family protein [Paenibacillus dendrobii]|uniref:metallophosphoesterase family protein n=1 Tax=Paenibacillus dendrobii TaxID=2691084 RepID=UPI001920FD09|nr:metallophosphoesterase family protein [Paenibacillus dendrobii]